MDHRPIFSPPPSPFEPYVEVFPESQEYNFEALLAIQLNILKHLCRIVRVIAPNANFNVITKNAIEQRYAANCTT